MITRKDLIEEKNFYLEISKLANDFLKKDIMAGKLRVSKSYAGYKYYYIRPGCDDRTNGEYIKKKNVKKYKNIAEKSYMENVLEFSEKHIKKIEGVLSYFEDDYLDKIYYGMSEGRQWLVTPIQETQRSYLENWMKKGLEEKASIKVYREEELVFVTDSGIKVRSKSEKIIADYLTKQNIPFIYEKPLWLQNGLLVIPDFTILDKKMRKELYYEHFGLMDNLEYAVKAIKKIDDYASNKIILGENLLVSFETGQMPLKMENVAAMINARFAK